MQRTTNAPRKPHAYTARLKMSSRIMPPIPQASTIPTRPAQNLNPGPSSEYAIAASMDDREVGVQRQAIVTSLDDGEFEAQEVGDVADPRQLVTDAERDVVRRADGAPGVEERGRPRGELDARVR